MRYKAGLCWLFLIIAGCRMYPAAGQELFMRHFTVDNGLPSNETYQVLEDTAGYLLVATDRGIARYDGYSFGRQLPGQPGTVTPVYDLYQSPGGHIYLPGLKGQVFVYKSDSLLLYPYSSRLSLADNNAGLLIADAVAEMDGGLSIRYNSNSNRLVHVAADGTIRQQPQAQGIYFDLVHHFCYQNLNGKMPGNTARPVYITWPDGTATTDTVTLGQAGTIRKPYYIRAGGLDLCSIGRLLLIYRNKKRVGTYLFPKNLLSIIAADPGELMTGFENGGVAVYRMAGDSVSGPVRNYLAPLSVSGIHKDFQGGYWFSTLDDGLYYAYAAPAAFWNSNSRIAFMAQQGDTVFVGHQDGRITLLHQGRQAGTLTAPLRPGERLLGCSFNRRGALILTTAGTAYLKQPAGWAAWPASNRLLLQTTDSNLFGAGIEHALLHEYTLPDRRLVKNIRLQKRILCIAEDGQQGLWLGTMEGLFHYDARSGLQQADSSRPALNDRIVSLHLRPDGWLAVATLCNGLVLYRNGRAQVLNTTNGLLSPIINGMVADGEQLWLGTNKGLTEVSVGNNRFRTRHYGSAAGLPTLDIHDFAVAGGWLYLKWINRAVAIPLASLRNAVPSRGAFLTGIQVNGRPVHGAAELPHHFNNVLFGFSSISFPDGSFQVYRYRLRGFDRQWTYTRERQASYTNLPPGRYEFQVQVGDVTGVYSSTVTAWPFTILQAWWQQGWFIVLSVLMALLGIWLIFRQRLGVIKRRNDLLLDVADSQQKALVQMISPHFLFNILNTAQSFILVEDKMKAASLISRIARLLRLSLEVNKDQYVLLEKELALLKNYMDLEEMRVPDKFACMLEPAPDLDPARVRIPGMLIQPFIENAVKHGVMHLRDRKGLISVRLQISDSMLLCTVADNGIGREAAAALNQASDSSRQSVGIDITRQRLYLLHRQRRSRFIFEIRDRKDGQGHACGTEVVFSIPYLLL